jgi:WhiB family redox-sensing transcriptional regulator
MARKYKPPSDPFGLPSLKVVEDDGWRDDALCRDYPDLDFFDIKGLGKRLEALRDVCNRCIVREDCLQFALDNEENYGVYGGLLPNERKALIRA